jgi:hypothetical protein
MRQTRNHVGHLQYRLWVLGTGLQPEISAAVELVRVPVPRISLEGHRRKSLPCRREVGHIHSSAAPTCNRRDNISDRECDEPRRRKPVTQSPAHCVRVVVVSSHPRSSASQAGMSVVVFHRVALIRQRDALRSVGTWYLAPFVPGLVLFVLGRYFQFHAPGRPLPWDRQIILLCAVIAVLISGINWLLNVCGAERLQREIDHLDGLR